MKVLSKYMGQLSKYRPLKSRVLYPGFWRSDEKIKLGRRDQKEANASFRKDHQVALSFPRCPRHDYAEGKARSNQYGGHTGFS